MKITKAIIKKNKYELPHYSNLRERLIADDLSDLDVKEITQILDFAAEFMTNGYEYTTAEFSQDIYEILS